MSLLKEHSSLFSANDPISAALQWKACYSLILMKELLWSMRKKKFTIGLV